MLAILHLFGTSVANLFKSRRRLEVENLFLRHQLNIALRCASHRLQVRGSDRALLVWMTWLWPGLLALSRVVQPDTILRWHRKGFTGYWRWKSRSPGGRPRIAREVRELIRRMSFENSLWGATKIHGELLKLGHRGRPVHGFDLHGAPASAKASIARSISAGPCTSAGVMRTPNDGAVVAVSPNGLRLHEVATRGAPMEQNLATMSCGTPRRRLGDRYHTCDLPDVLTALATLGLDSKID
jgi:hypothetical protein